MKRRTVTRTPLTSSTPAGNTAASDTAAGDSRSPESSISNDATSDAKAAEKRWELDQAEGIAAPVIRANMISLRISYQGRIQVAFFDHR